MEYKDSKIIRETVQKAVGDTCIQIDRLGGFTNRTYKVVTQNKGVLVVRIPGEGTEKMICRADERTSMERVGHLAIDAVLLYFGDDGIKVSEYIEGAQTMSASLLRTPEKIQQAADVLRRLHNSHIDTGIEFNTFHLAECYEHIIKNHQVAMYPDYDKIKDQVMQIYQKQGICSRVPCHNDPLCENWVQGNDRLYLIDWEYAGMNDFWWDLAAVSIEAEFEQEQDELLLHAYFGEDIKKEHWKLLLANKIYVDFLWTLWAKTKVPFEGEAMELWASERYQRLKTNLDHYSSFI